MKRKIRFRKWLLTTIAFGCLVIHQPASADVVGAFSGTLSYTWGDAYTINDGTSSQNNSQWRGYRNVGGLNAEGQVMRSTFAGLHRILLSASYRKEYLGFLGSQVSIFYNGSTGILFSYTYDERGFGGMVNDGAFNNNNFI